MRIGQITSNLDVFTDHKGGLGALKDYFLSTAFKGNLVLGNVSDSASDFFVELQKCGSNYDSNKEMSPNDLSGIWEGFLLYDLPKSWKWMRLDQIGTIVGGGTPDTANSTYWAKDSGTPWITPADMRHQGMYVLGGKRNLTDIGLRESSSKLLPIDSVVFSSRAPIGYVGISGLPLATNQGFKSCVPFMPETAKYIYFYLMFIGAEMNRRATGTTFKEVSGKQFAATPIPVPPLNVQQRIVEEIQEFLAIVIHTEDKINSQTQLANSARKSALDAISTAQSQKDFEIAWKRIQGNWRVIAGTPDAIESIKTLILDLAVRGDLVTVNHPNMIETIGWSASELKLDDSKLWHLPTLRGEKKHGWNRIPLAKIGSWGSGGTPTSSRKDYYQNGTIPWAVIGDLNNDIMTSTEASITDKALADSSSKLVPKGAILIAMYGASIGKTAITGIECCTNQAIAHCVVDTKLVSKDYFFIVAKSLKRHLIQEGKGAAQPNISQSVLKHLIIDLPPLAEQALIVERVKALMELCDRLNISLRESELLAEKFSRSVVSASA
jgi:type I restriction enzyme S subunit